jgi:hypothetical protein
MDPGEPANVRAIAGALKMVGEFKLAVDITYSKLGKMLDVPKLSAPTPSDSNPQYDISPADEIVEGDFADLKEIKE